MIQIRIFNTFTPCRQDTVNPLLPYPQMRGLQSDSFELRAVERDGNDSATPFEATLSSKIPGDSFHSMANQSTNPTLSATILPPENVPIIKFGASAHPGRTVKKALFVDGLSRQFRVHLPPDYQKSEHLSVVIVLHGASLSGKIMEMFTGFNRLADKERFIAVYPDAVERNRIRQWSDGRSLENNPSSKIDDMQFLEKMIDNLAEDYHINKSQVFGTGFSSGGMLLMKSALEKPNMFRAIALVAASFPVPQPETIKDLTNLKINVLMINGTEDTAFPWEGGDENINIRGLLLQKIKVGAVAPVEDSIEYLAEVSGGLSEFTDWNRVKGTKNKRTAVYVKRFYTKNGSIVRLWKIVKGGHTWPGLLKGKLDGRRLAVLGLQSGLPASEIIFEFFKENGIKVYPMSRTKNEIN